MASRGFRQTFDHHTNHANPNHTFAMIEADFVIAAEAARLVEPSVSSSDDPALCKNLAAFDVVTLSHFRKNKDAFLFRSGTVW